MAKADLNAEVTKLRAVLEKSSRLRLEFLGQLSSLLRQHNVDVSDALLSQLTVGLKAGDPGAESPKQHATSPKQNLNADDVAAASPKQNVAAASPKQNVTAASPKQNVTAATKPASPKKSTTTGKKK